MTRNCSHYQSQLLDHLYGLLEPDESLALVEHVGQCDECRQLLQKADGQKRLIAAAARSQFHQVQFRAPEPEPAASETVAASPRRSRSLIAQLSWQVWAAVAAILFLVGGVGLPFGRHLLSTLEARHQVDHAQARMDEVRNASVQIRKEYEQQRVRAARELQDVQAEIERLETAQAREIQAITEKLKKLDLYVVVAGPETLRPGEPAQFQIETRNLDHQPEPAQLTVRVREETTNKVIYEEDNVASKGKHTLNLSSAVTMVGGSHLALEVVARGQAGVQGELKEKLTLIRSAYVTHLATDKPMYQPGETVRFRSLTLDRYTFKPAQADLVLTFTIQNPQGQNVYQQPLSTRLMKDGKDLLGPDRQPIRGIAAGEFTIPERWVGGEYTLSVQDPGGRFPTEKRKFIVNRYQKPRLNKELKNWDKKTYGPGEKVTAFLEVTRAEGGLPLAGMPVTATVTIDGKQYRPDGHLANNPADAQWHGRTDALGRITISFTLPGDMERGDASLAVQFTDGSSFEALVKPIPVVVKKLRVDFYPEGGELVAGVPNRVYFRARTMLDKAADVKGAIIDRMGKEVARIETLTDPEPGISQGMGMFTFIPVADETYELKIETPAGIEGRFPLPAIQADGVALQVPGGVSKDPDPMGVVIHSTRARDLLIGAYCRGRLLDYQQVQVVPNQPLSVTLKPAEGIGGVYRITVFERSQAGQREQLRPVAERLVYREPARRLNLAIRTDQRVYVPGSRVNLTVTGSTETTQPAPSVILVGVVDKSVVKLADEKTARAMPTHFLLTNEVDRPEDLEHADILLADHPKSAQALDLLLGTQGWRRFIESDPKGFENRAKEVADTPERQRLRSDVDRLMIATGGMRLTQAQQKQVRDSIQLQERSVVELFRPRFEELQARQESAVAAVNLLEEGSKFKAQSAKVQEQGKQAQAEYQAALASLRVYDEANQRIRSVLLLVFGVLLLVAGLGSLVLAASRTRRRTTPYFAAAIGSLAACGLVLLSTFLLQSDLPVAATGVAMMSDESGWQTEPGAMPAPAAAEAAPVQDDARLPMEAGRGGGNNRGVDEPRLRQAPPGNGLNGAFDAAGSPPAPPAAGRVNMLNAAPPPAPRLAGPMAAAKRMEDRAGLPAPEANFQRARAAMAPGQPFDGLIKKDEKPQAGFARKGRGLQDAQRDEINALRRNNIQLEAIEKAELQRKAGVQADADKFAQLSLFKAAREAAANKPYVTPNVVREYAHKHQAGDDPYLRSDFAETVYWHPALVMPDGKVDVQFDLSDSVTTFQVLALGNTPDGRLGQVSSEFEARKPFTLDVKVPLEATANDIIDIPVAVRNAGDEPRMVQVSLQLTGLAALAPSDTDRQLLLPPQQGARIIYRVKPAIKQGTVFVEVRGHTEPLGADSVRQAIQIVPEGFPIVGQASDVLERAAHHDIELPRHIVPSTLDAELTLYPSALADLQKGLEGLLREPNGCFEQTSTTNYPNVMILEYLKQMGQANPELEQRARELLTRGYGRLISFECQTANPAEPRQGYEWFGGRAPAHEALTAYGLLQFMDMIRIGHPVDRAMVERTRAYLLNQRDGQGGFKRNTRALDSFGRAPAHITNAYIVWAITEADHDNPEKADLTKEIDALTQQAADSKDPYFIALVANALLNRGRDASDQLRKLTELQKLPDGFLPGAESSITRSGGRDLLIESTALAVLAWLKANQPLAYHQNVQAAVKWIGQQRGGRGGFGSTQSTILSLRALLAFARARKGDPQEAGDVTIKVKDEVVATGRFDPNASQPIRIKIPDPERILKAGKNEVAIELTGKSVVPYTLAWSYHALVPESAEGCAVRLAAALDRATARDGETVHLHVTLQNDTARGQGMTVAIIGLPAGLELPPDFAQLKDYARLKNDGAEPGTISFFEVRGTRELVLYWRDLAPNQKVDLHLDLICKVPGEFRGPASRAYLYYNADHKHWIEPVAMTIIPKE